MGRRKDTGRIELRRVFESVQKRMLADLSASGIFEHPAACGAATEQQWIRMFNAYLPERYRAASAFILDSTGARSRQIDVAVYDRFYSPVLFPHESGPHIPAESVYAVFEVKQTLAATWIADAGRKVASVRRLHRTSGRFLSAGSRCEGKKPPPILAGILSLDAVWTGPFRERLLPLLQRLGPAERLDLGCCLRQGAFEQPSGSSQVVFGERNEALMFFFLRLLRRLQELGTAPALDLECYTRTLRAPSS
jgi:hypothetical protein